MIMKKPNFWDYKKPNILSYFLLIFTIPIIINNYLINKHRKQKTNETKHIKTICVGNIYIGGTAKTPLSIKISQILNNINLKTAIIKKFYSSQIDEQKLIANSNKLYCEKNRIESLKNAQKDMFDVAIFDDGLQDKTLNYDLKFVCFNTVKWIGNGLLIPAGPLREKLKSIKNFDAVFLNGNEENVSSLKFIIKKINKNIRIFETYYKPLNIHSFNNKDKFLIFSGIGNPENFKETLTKNNLNVIYEIKFPDHYQYTEKDIENIKQKAKKLQAKILTTEKDFLKIKDETSNDINYLKIDLVIKSEDKLINLIKFIK
jgi:tetraacyldisaccharide 4'-kinase